MLISDFARITGLSTDTVRLYVRKRLITGQAGAGANAYRHYGETQIEQAQAIRLAKALGYTLREIADIMPDYISGEMSTERAATLIGDQLKRLDRKARQLEVLRRFLREKLDWLEADRRGPGPKFVATDA